MNAGVTRVLALRPPLSSSASTHSLPSSSLRPHLHLRTRLSTPSRLYLAASAFTSASSDTMLGRARDRAKGAGAPAGASVSKPTLATQLFPSSSPSASSQQRDITSWATAANKPNSRGIPSATRTAGPLKARSANPQVLPSPRSSSASAMMPNAAGMSRTNSVISICGNAGNFEDRYSVGKLESYGSTIGSVYVGEEDLSDDNTLELDYECPASLPPLPPSFKPKPPSTIQAGPATNTSTTTAAPPPPSSQIPWSSSPQHHLFPPVKPQKPKREPPSQAPPPAKRRTLPKNWVQEDVEASQDKESAPPLSTTRDTSSSATPLPNKTKELLWDATQSAVKERRKQLKSQSKKSEPETHLPLDEARVSTSGHTGAKKASSIALSSEQKHIIDLVIKDQRSVFFTGPAGTGKSVLMRAIIAELKKKWARDPERLSVTASTGLAACNIGGQTLHSFAGIGLGKEDVPTLVKKIRRNAKAKNRWLRTKTLIIDEVSMVDGELFDKLSLIARTIRNNGRAFGGIQLVITGDFFQLPPVPDGGKKEAKFAFDAATWNTSIDHTIGLTEVFRQKDPHFAGMLNEMRLGNISNDSIQTFKELARPLTFDDGLDVTELFPTRQEVERSNESRLRNLSGETYHYDCVDSGDANVRDKLLANMMAPKSIDLKKGAQVMLIKNMDDTLVNGSLGKVIGFMPEVTFESWVAGEHSGGLDDDMVDANSKKKIKAFSRDPENMKDLREYPVIRFITTDGTHRVILCTPEDWKVELPTGEVQASRKQLPLILAWALSIHKAQGQTLERVKVDLGKVFEKGQAYVALSRAVSKNGLQVLRFEKNKVMAHPRVIQFYNKLYSAESAIKTKKTPAISDFVNQGVSSASTRRKGLAVVNLNEEEVRAAAYS